MTVIPPLFDTRSKVYYLYRHIRNDTHQPFYIGIGTRNDGKFHYQKIYQRAFFHAPSKRSTHWRNVYNACKGDIDIEILFETYSLEEIKIKEKEFISLYQRKDCCGGMLVNHTNGGDGIEGYIASEETRALMSKAHSGDKNGFYGKHHSEATKVLLSEIHSVINNGADNGFYGKTHNDDTRKHMSLKARARWDRGDLHLPPALTGANNTSSKLILAIPPAGTSVYLIHGCIKKFLAEHELSKIYYEYFVDKGKCTPIKPVKSKGRAANTIGWEFRRLGRLMDFNTEDTESIFQIIQEELKDMDVTIVHYKKS